MSLVHELLEEAARASSGCQRFVFIVGSTARVAQITIPGDADNIQKIKTLAQTYKAMQPIATLPGKWAELIGEGISDNIASRMAYMESCRLCVFPVGTGLIEEDGETRLEPPDAIPDPLKAVDTLELARHAGGVFNFLSDEIIRRVNGINFDIEAQVVAKLGEGSPATTGG